MHYGQIFDCDPANGPGMRVSLFVSGCTHHCPGCFNPETWDFNYGKLFDSNASKNILRMLSNPYIQGLTILGGEPMEPANQDCLVHLLRQIRNTYPCKDIWVYTGYTFEELSGAVPGRCQGPHTMEILHMVDVLVDGEFILAQKDISLTFRGSGNQRILDLPKSLSANRPIWLEKYRN